MSHGCNHEVHLQGEAGSANELVTWSIPKNVCMDANFL